MEKSLSPLSVRQKLGLTQVEMAKLLDVTSEYLSMIETGKRPVSKKLLRKFESLDGEPPTEKAVDGHVAEGSMPYGSLPNCRYPDVCNLKTELAQVKSSLADLQGKMNTLLGLLGGPLRSAVGLDKDGKDRAV